MLSITKADTNGNVKLPNHSQLNSILSNLQCPGERHYDVYM